MSVNLIDRRVTLRELRLFLAVAQSGSILKAANEIGLTQPALSKSIAELERTFGVRLFDRTNRGVTTTPQGDVLLRRATGMFEELRQAVDELGTLADASIGELRLGGTPSMCAGMLPLALTTILKERPKFRFHVAELESGKLGSEVLARSLDIGIGREQLGVENNGLTFDRLFDDRLFIVAGALHPLASRRTTTLEEAARQQWVLPVANGGVTAQLATELRKHGLELPHSVVTSMSMLVRYELIATNGFLTAIYGSVLRFGKVPRFLRVLPIDLPIGMPIGLLRLRNRTLAPSAELFAMVTRGIVRPMHSLSAKQLRREMQANS